MTETFISAAEHLGAACISANPDPDEPFSDAIRAVQLTATQFDRHRLSALVVRHHKEGVPTQVAQLDSIRERPISVINAGDGRHENPTEALAYIYLIWKKYRTVAGLTIFLVGDMKFDPLTRSLLFALCRLGGDIHIAAPSGLVPRLFPPGIDVTVHHQLLLTRYKPDVLLSVPVGPEAFEEGILPSRKEYLRLFSLSRSISEQGDLPFIIRCAARLPHESADPCADLRGTAFVCQPSDDDVSAIRMAALKHCLGS